MISKMNMSGAKLQSAFGANGCESEVRLVEITARRDDDHSPLPPSFLGNRATYRPALRSLNGQRKSSPCSCVQARSLSGIISYWTATN